MKRNIVFGLCTVIVAVGGSLLVSRRDAKTREPAAPTSRNEDRTAEFEQEVARLRREVGYLSAKANAGPPEVVEAAATVPAAREPDTAPVDPELALAQGRQAVTAKFAHLSSVLAQQPRDQVWADSAEKELSSVVEQLRESGLKGATLLNSECRSSMCKVEVSYDSLRAQTQTWEKLRSPLFWGGEMRRFEENGQLRSTNYYYREGYDQPL